MLMNKYDIHIDINEAYRYMGCRGVPDNSLINDLNSAAELIKIHSRPHVIKKFCDIDRSKDLSLEGTCLKLEGKSIAALLHECKMCVIFCATIGNDIEALIRKWQIKDITFAAMLDACASSAVECLCNHVEKELSEEYSAQGYHLTDRFSPGYGDLPLSIQSDFCAVLDTCRKIGVCVSESGIMIPRKSVTAIIGISHKEQKHYITGCNDCRLMDGCNFRKNGVTCYGQVI